MAAVFGVFLQALPMVSAQAQSGVKLDDKLDDKWRYALGAGVSYSSGNTRSSTLSFTIDGARASEQNKWVFGGRYLRGSSEDTITADQAAFGSRYDTNLGASDWFNFVQGDYLRDRPANLASRLSAAVGFGRHVYRGVPNSWDVYAGVGYTRDQYIAPVLVTDRFRENYTHPDLLLGEESAHKLTDTTTFKQKLVFYPNAADFSQFRTTFDAGLAVAINKLLSLTTTLSYRYNSDPGPSLKKGDLLFITGLSIRTD